MNRGPEADLQAQVVYTCVVGTNHAAIVYWPKTY
jgi:hypothetical protein